ncbi:TolC family protein [Capnocytophaga catalasegens]|uniref:TolC family protein n=1 Tax=Capnocytophaga catalasegens TaxID=1004260 RepID=A0AAV5AWW3_9FLAO|nr:TolC family protein [Capnocytophaga catalasegens]GIZ15809.1 hypothetical protein RCZ03_18090 [Capnocytophaga catalasegens]GJM49821.1 hypothetical protein RCZ15_07960 [Capnocytophaga catalasegens]GJM52986.1 hypothetical protein RCZ16_13030 [Capnocytophaga catalasegens]
MISERYESLREALTQQERALEYYQTGGNSLADELLRMAQSSFKHGEIDYFQYILTLKNAYQLKVEHLQSLNSYNQTLLQLHYLMWEDNFDTQF